jgi:hypothetical protein
LQVNQTDRDAADGSGIGKGSQGDPCGHRFFSADLHAVPVCEKPPHDYDEKAQAQKIDNTLNAGPEALWQEHYEELHRNVSAHNQRYRNRKRNRNQLGQYYDIQGAENGGAKNFGTHHVHTGHNDDQKKRSEPDPFNPFAKPSIEFFEFIQHIRPPAYPLKAKDFSYNTFRKSKTKYSL